MDESERSRSVLGISARTLRLAVERGEIEAAHPLPDGPWVFHRQALEAPTAAALVARPCELPRRRRGPRGASMRRAAGRMLAASAGLGEEQHVQSLEPARGHGEAIARDDARRLGPQKLTP